MTFKEELMAVLKAELEGLKAIKELAYQKTDVIVNNEVEELEKITKKETELINQMANIEKARLKLLNSWGLDMNTPLSHIIEKIPEEKEDLEKLAEELKAYLMDIQVRNNMNKELIEDNLEWIEFNINLLTQTAAPTTYNKKDSKTGQSLFDRKV